jgi:hypothetical protein
VIQIVRDQELTFDRNIFLALVGVDVYENINWFLNGKFLSESFVVLSFEVVVELGGHKARA